MIPVFYRPEQSCAEAASFSPSAGKPKLVVEDWLSCSDIVQNIHVKTFDAATDKMLGLAHSRAYVDGIMAGQIRNGFGNTNQAIAQSLRYTVGSIVAAARHVLTTPPTPPGSALNVAVSPTSGFHHAGHAASGGFCTFNGLMVAAIHMYDLGLARRILIVDMDQHYGDGTSEIISDLGIDYIDHITAEKSYSTAESALACADLGANAGMQENRYDLVLYQAGADIHVDDPLGGLLTTAQMRRRDAFIFAGCRRFGTPIVWNLAGGYRKDASGGIGPVLALHRNTMLECIGATRGAAAQ